jgi:CPA1 family monovalent cation:H+ antiporter
LLAFEWIIGLLLGAVALSALARRLQVPYPTFLAIGGMLLAFVPSGPSWALDPELALALFVAPVLLDAAFDTSLRDLRNNWLPVSTLVLVAVGVTTAAVAVVAHWLRPDMPWAVAIALGAIVAPPDAAAATAILRQVSLPYRIQKILEGESLLNDASALLIYRVAVGLVAAEHLGLSGILTIVVYAMTMARSAGMRMPARLRVPSYAVWETMVFVLNVLAFMLIGLQLRPIWSGLDDEVRWKYCSFAAAILAVVILARILWVMPYGALLRTLKARNLLPAHVVDAVPTLKRGFIVSWCGMRGIVTLAAAFALPEWFPYRDLILLTAFAVVLGSLVIQGLTLRPLILALNFADDDPVGREAARARGVVFRAALDEIDADPSEEAEILRLEYRAVLLRAENDPDGGLTSRELPSDPFAQSAPHRGDRRRRVPSGRGRARPRRAQRAGVMPQYAPHHEGRGGS